MLRLSAFWLLAGLLNAQQPLAAPGLKIRVQVILSVPETITSQISNAMNRELRSLADIELVDNNPTYVIRVMGLPARIGKRISGYALSFLIVEPLVPDAVDGVITANIPMNMRTALKSYISGSERFLSQLMRIIPPDRIQDECREIVATLNAKLFEETRRRLRR
jgi:hypothetical protein